MSQEPRLNKELTVLLKKYNLIEDDENLYLQNVTHYKTRKEERKLRLTIVKKK